MSVVLQELKSFRRFLDEKIQDGEELTPEQALAKWRASDTERTAAIEAIREGLEDVRSGRLQSFEDFDREFRSRRDLARDV